MFDKRSIKAKLPSSMYLVFSGLTILMLVILFFISVFVFVMAILLEYSSDPVSKELFLDVFSGFSQEFQTKLSETIDSFSGYPDDGIISSSTLNDVWNIPHLEIYNLPTFLFDYSLYGILYVSSFLIFLYVVIVSIVLAWVFQLKERKDSLTYTLVLFFLSPYLVLTIFGPILFMVYSIEVGVKGEWKDNNYS